MSKIIIPKGYEALFRTIWIRTKGNYILTRNILIDEYGVYITLEP